MRRFYRYNKMIASNSLEQPESLELRQVSAMSLSLPTYHQGYLDAGSDGSAETLENDSLLPKEDGLYPEGEHGRTHVCLSR